MNVRAFTLTLAMIAGLFTSFAFAADNAAEGKIAVVDFGRAIFSSNVAKARLEQLKQQSSFANKARTVRVFVADGLKTTVGLVFYGMFKLIQNALDRDDKKEYENSPRGRADRNFDRWLEQRDRWREGK